MTMIDDDNESLSLYCTARHSDSKSLDMMYVKAAQFHC